MFKILSTYGCWKKYIKCNIWWVAVRPSYIQDARFLKVNSVHRCTGSSTEIRTQTHGKLSSLTFPHTVLRVRAVTTELHVQWLCMAAASQAFWTKQRRNFPPINATRRCRLYVTSPNCKLGSLLSRHVIVTTLDVSMQDNRRVNYWTPNSRSAS
jgi:hypothetical protein